MAILAIGKPNWSTTSTTCCRKLAKRSSRVPARGARYPKEAGRGGGAWVVAIVTLRRLINSSARRGRRARGLGRILGMTSRLVARTRRPDGWVCRWVVSSSTSSSSSRSNSSRLSSNNGSSSGSILNSGHRNKNRHNHNNSSSSSSSSKVAAFWVGWMLPGNHPPRPPHLSAMCQGKTP